jgi:hypothetical protein
VIGNFDVFKKIWSKSSLYVEIRYGMTGHFLLPPPVANIPGENFKVPFHYPKVPLEAPVAPPLLTLPTPLNETTTTIFPHSFFLFHNFVSEFLGDQFYQTWSSWGNCSNTCEGKTTRTRNCTVAKCTATGLMNVTKDCNTELCDS